MFSFEVYKFRLYSNWILVHWVQIFLSISVVRDERNKELEKGQKKLFGEKSVSLIIFVH